MTRSYSNYIGLGSLGSVFLYHIFFSLSRKQFLETSLTYLGLFAILWIIYKIFQSADSKNFNLFPKFQISKLQWTGGITLIFLVGLLFRLVLLFETPNLSQDFYRFIWDGHQLLNGYNPYVSLPDDLIENASSHIPHATYLHDKMGDLSSSNYSNYPPLNQLLFSLAALIGGENLLVTVISMRLIIILADVFIFFYGVRLLQMMGRPAYLILLYYLNPFIIIELTGNLHWEGAMACLLLISLYYLFRIEVIKSAWFMGHSILLKIMPVIVLPLLVRKLRPSRLLLFYSFTAIVVFAAFSPFLSIDLVEKYSASIGLWFGKFEFNASIFYMVRELGYAMVGYDVIKTAGKILPVITFVLIWIIALLRKNERPEILLESVVFSFFTYLMLSTTVHPWYLTIPLLFSVFTRFRFMVLWSLLIFLSYEAYSNPQFKENLWFLTIEYAAVIGYFAYELWSSVDKKKVNN